MVTVENGNLAPHLMAQVTVLFGCLLPIARAMPELLKRSVLPLMMRTEIPDCVSIYGSNATLD